MTAGHASRLAARRDRAFRVVVAGAGRAVPLDDGWLTWTSATGTRARIPVVLTR